MEGRVYSKSRQSELSALINATALQTGLISQAHPSLLGISIEQDTLLELVTTDLSQTY